MSKSESPSDRGRNYLLLLLCSISLVALVVPRVSVTGEGLHEAKVSMSVSDARPVAFGAKALEQQYGWIITYEDPPYLHESELTDVTEQVRRDLDKYKPGEAPKVIVPKGGSLAFQFDVDPATDKPADAALVVQQLLDAYALTGHPGIFRVERDDERLHIIASAYKDKDGVLKTLQSVFDVRITFAPQKRDGIQLLDAFCSAVTQASGTHVVFATVPTNLLHQHKTESGATNEKARDFLTHELNSINAKLSWQLFYNPVNATYYLNLHII